MSAIMDYFKYATRMEIGITIAIAVIVLGLAGWGIYYGIETIGIPVDMESCDFVSKKYHPAYTTTRMMTVSSGKSTTSVPQTVHHPERWTVSVVFEDGDSASKSVGERTYEKIGRKTGLEAQTKKGRFSGHRYVETIMIKEAI